MPKDVANSNCPDAAPFLMQWYQGGSKKTGQTEGLLPLSTRLTNDIRACRSSFPSLFADVLMRSFKCCGRRPSRPPTDSLGKERMDWTISSLVTQEIEECSLGGGGMHESSCDGGCLDWGATRVASSNSMVEVSKQGGEQLLCNLPPRIWMKHV